MKILYIVSLVLTLLFGALDFYYIEMYQQLWLNDLFSDIYSSDYSYDYYDDSYFQMRDLTFQAAGVSILFVVFYILTFSFTLSKIKRLTAKVMSIIGLSFAGIMFLLLLLPLGDPGAISWNEFGPAIIIFVLIMLAFCIVNLVQAVRNESAPKPNQSTIDDMI